MTRAQVMGFQGDHIGAPGHMIAGPKHFVGYGATYVLTHWARDRAGRQVSLEQAVKAMTSIPANVVGLRDRGVIAPGYKADINVIDHAGLTLHSPFIVDNLPAGGRRHEQSASGYRWTFVSGTAIIRDDHPTGALPGKLVRSARKVMSQAA
jgi:N-acyl-D-amino-acid deacylase